MADSKTKIMLHVATNTYNEATLVNGKSMCDGQGNVNDVYNLYNNKTVCQ